MSEKRYLSVHEVAERLSVSAATSGRWAVEDSFGRRCQAGTQTDVLAASDVKACEAERCEFSLSSR